VPYQLDGDPGGELPVEIRVLPGRLALLVDRTWAVRRGMTPADEEVAP
jgi:diacylglycerol kinase family enzyme